jgi:cyclic pyranopterin phosphate synthase
MVEVGAKPETARAARAQGCGAVKRTAELIPLCHPLRVTGVEVKFTPYWGRGRSGPGPDGAALAALIIDVEVRAYDRTGVEMEALTAVSVAALTIYDMCKAVERGMTIGAISLLEKSGGRSGTYVRP